MNINKLCAAFAATVLSFGIPAANATSFSEDETLIQGPPVHEFQSPYQGALVCLRDHLPPELKKVSFGVMRMQDETGQVNYVADNGTGAFSSQGGVDRIITALTTIGVAVVEMDPSFFGAMEWYAKMQGYVGNDDHLYRIHVGPNKRIVGVTNRMPMPPDQPPQLEPYQINMPDIFISGGITSIGFIPGEGGELSIAGAGGGYREYRVHVGMDVRATRTPMVVPDPTAPPSPYSGAMGGQVITAEHVSKQVVADEAKLDAGSILGSILVTADAGKMDREAIQDAESTMDDYVAYKMVANSLGYHGCDPQLDYGAQLAATHQQ